MIIRLLFGLSLISLTGIGMESVVGGLGGTHFGSFNSGSRLFEQPIACEPTPPDRREVDDTQLQNS